LNNEFYGKDFKNKIKDFLACYILSSSIEPDRSRTNMYYPLYWSKFDFFDLGGKKVKPTHYLPEVQKGLPKNYCSKVSYKSFYGTFYYLRE